MQDRAEVACQAKNLEIVSSNLTPATRSLYSSMDSNKALLKPKCRFDSY